MISPSRGFWIGLAAILLAGISILVYQHRALEEVRVMARETGHRMSAPSPSDSTRREKTREQERVPAELIRLRSEVGALRRELRDAQRPKFDPDESAQDWDLVHSGLKPSAQPGFQYFSAITNAGNATPTAGLATFNYVMRNQQREPLTETRMKTIWDVPDDFDSPDARYSIDLGEGMGNEVGYRIVEQTQLSTNEVRLTLEYERPDGSSFRRHRILIERNGAWRVKPAGLTRPDVAQ